MILLKRIFLFAVLFQTSNLNAQNVSNDSVKVARTFGELLKICSDVSADLTAKERGSFSKAASYIVYRGENGARKWKDFTNYSNRDEKVAVDNICMRINGSVNQDPNPKIIGYETATESEGIWHILMVSYTVQGGGKEAVFAFLKIKGRFVLGDID